jgi:hypothetical protein
MLAWSRSTAARGTRYLRDWTEEHGDRRSSVQEHGERDDAGEDARRVVAERERDPGHGRRGAQRGGEVLGRGVARAPLGEGGRRLNSPLAAAAPRQ